MNYLCAGVEMVTDLQMHSFTSKMHMPDTLNKEAVGANNACLYTAELPDV